MTDDVVEDAELRDELLRRVEVDQQARHALTPLLFVPLSGPLRVRRRETEEMDRARTRRATDP